VSSHFISDVAPYWVVKFLFKIYSGGAAVAAFSKSFAR